MNQCDRIKASLHTEGNLLTSCFSAIANEEISCYDYSISEKRLYKPKRERERDEDDEHLMNLLISFTT